MSGKLKNHHIIIKKLHIKKRFWIALNDYNHTLFVITSSSLFSHKQSPKIGLSSVCHGHMLSVKFYKFRRFLLVQLVNLQGVHHYKKNRSQSKSIKFIEFSAQCMLIRKNEQRLPLAFTDRALPCPETGYFVSIIPLNRYINPNKNSFIQRRYIYFIVCFSCLPSIFQILNENLPNHLPRN